MRLKIISGGIAATVLAATAAAADPGFYYGVGLGYSMMESKESDLPGADASEEKAGLIGLTLGYRWENASIFYGAELDGDFSFGTDFENSMSGTPCSVSASGPYWCSHDATLRLRGVVGQALPNGLEMFGSLGLAIVFGESAVQEIPRDNVASTGFTVGIGVQQPFARGGMGRLELIYDRADNSNGPTLGPGNPVYDPTFEAFTLKATYLF